MEPHQSLRAALIEHPLTTRSLDPRAAGGGGEDNAWSTRIGHTIFGRAP